MTYEEFVSSSSYYINKDIELIRHICYEIHMLEATDSADYRSFNEFNSMFPISNEIRTYLNRIHNGKWP